MSDLRKAAQAALEALRVIQHATAPGLDGGGHEAAFDLASAAEDKLKTALTEPQPEPVAWCPNLNYPDYEKQRVWANGAPKQSDFAYWAKCGGITLAYAAPQAQKPLTDEQIVKIISDATGWVAPDSPFFNLARAIERAHGIGDANP